MKRWIYVGLFIAYCLFIVWSTILSRPQTAPHADLRFMWSYREMLAGDPNWKADVVQNVHNILFFIPFGFLMPVNRWMVVPIATVCFSMAIELIQYFGGYGLCELDDVICNTLGAVLGFLLLSGIHKLKGKVNADT